MTVPPFVRLTRNQYKLITLLKNCRKIVLKNEKIRDTAKGLSRRLPNIFDYKRENGKHYLIKIREFRIIEIQNGKSEKYPYKVRIIVEK